MCTDFSMDNVVKDILRKYQGGEEFFACVDRTVRQKPFIDAMYDVFKDDLNRNGIIVTGKFGKFFSLYYRNARLTTNPIITVPGGLRRGRGINLSHYGSKIFKQRNFIFIDDSFYSGTTRNVILKELLRYGGTITKTYVVYDGSKEKDGSVLSIYRYYDKLAH